MRVVLRRTVVGNIDRHFDSLSGSHHQSHVNCVSSVYGIYVSIYDSDDDFCSGYQNFSQCHQQLSFSGLNSHLDDQTTQMTETPGFKPCIYTVLSYIDIVYFTVWSNYIMCVNFCK